MSFLGEIVETLKNEGSKELVLPDALTFPTIDIDKIEKKLELEETAKLNGEKNLPESNSTELDLTQNQIISTVITALRPFQASFNEAITAYNARLAALDPLGFDAKIRGLAAKKKAEIQMIATQAQGEIYLVENNLRQRENEYQKFKIEHGNPADPNLGIPKILKYFIIFGLVVFEGILNSFFLGDYMRGGLLEGLAYAIGIPVLSIVFMGILAGTNLRKMYFSKGLWKIIHATFVLIAFAGSLAITLLLASLRISAEATDDYQNVLVDVWLSYLVFNPIYPISAPGILLIGLGMAFFIIATFDIKSLDHEIPGFLQAYNIREKAHQDYNKKMEYLNRKLISIANTSKEISNAFDSLQAWQIEYQNILINKRQLILKFNAYVRHIEDIINTSLSKYRQINATTRKTISPAYFSEKWIYPEYLTENSDFTGLVEEFQEKLKRVYENIEKIQKEVEDEVRRLSGVIIPIKKALGEI
jgi:hypothetical protein